VTEDRTSQSDWLVLGMAASCIVIVRAPLLVGHTQPLKLLMLLLLWAATAAAAQGERRFAPPREGALALGLLYAGSVGLEVIRGSKAGVYGSAINAYQLAVLFLGLVVFAYMAINRASSEVQRERRLIALALAPGVYVTLNVLLWAAGISSPAADAPGGGSVALGDPSSTLAAVGIHVGRVEFPMANSINLFGVAAAGGFAAIGVMLVRRSPHVPRRLALLLAAGCLAGLLLGDSRGSLLIAIAVVLWFVFSARIRAASGVAVLVPVLPLLLLTVLGLVAGTAFDTSLSRSGSGDLATGTNRLYIWQGAWDVIKHPAVDAVWGWGAGGQITSGASLNYAYLFTGVADPTTMPAHSLVLQTLLDGGYIGLLILLAVLASSITSLARITRARPRSGSGPLLASVVTIVLAGTTEVAPTYYAQEAFITMLLAVGAAAAVAVRIPAPAAARVPVVSASPSATA
jgi:hypothetical protein